MPRATTERLGHVADARAYLRAIAAAVGGVVDANDQLFVGGRRVALRMGATIDIEGSAVSWRPWADPVSEAIEAATAALRSHAA